MARRTLTEDISWDDAFALVAYTADALSLAADDGDAEVGALAPPVEKLLTDWEGLDDERRARRRAIGRANALIKRRDLQSDAAMEDLHNDVLATVKQDRSAPFFIRIFKDPLSAIIRLALESQLPVMRLTVLKLAEDETPANIKSKHTGPLSSVIQKGDAAVQVRLQAYADSGRTSARVASWRDDANRVLLGVEGRLQEIASQRGLGIDWVDSHFPAIQRRKKKNP